MAMFRVRLKHKINGNVLECVFRYGKDGEHIFYDTKTGKDIENPSEYYEEPYTPYELFGIECMDGWKDLYMPIIEYVNKYNEGKEDKDKLEITQIKEKWAHLDFNCSFYTEELSEMINKAYKESEYVCEKCGARNNVGIVVDGHNHTVCMDCLLKELSEDKNKRHWRNSNSGEVYLVSYDGNMELIRSHKTNF